MRYEKDVICSAEKQVLERPRLSWEVHINLILGVRECDSMGLIAVTLNKRPVNAAMKSPPAKKLDFVDYLGEYYHLKKDSGSWSWFP
jgi:hypothetical protein